jgi:hypothetical protein
VLTVPPMLEAPEAPALLRDELPPGETPPVAPVSMFMPLLPPEALAPACPLAVALAPVLPAEDVPGFGELLLHAVGTHAMARNRARYLTLTQQAEG